MKIPLLGEFWDSKIPVLGKFGDKDIPLSEIFSVWKSQYWGKIETMNPHYWG